MHLKSDSRPAQGPLAGASGELSLSELSHLIASGTYDDELRLIVEQAQMLTLASGAAIALRQGEFMVCRARAGATAPELGARLDIQSGLSGECVRAARILVCGDTENDSRVNLDVCRYLGLRSIAVLPISLANEVVGVFEVFSAQPGAFSVNEVAALESMRDLVLSVIRPAPPQAESPAATALASRAAQERSPVFLDPEDDLLCEIEQRLRPQPESDSPARAFQLVRGSGAQPAPPPTFARSAAPAPPGSVVPATQLASYPDSEALPVAPAPAPITASAPAPPRVSSAPPPTAATIPAPAAPVSNAPREITPPIASAPIASAPRRMAPFANADPEDDLVCEIEMRTAGRPVPRSSLSTFAPAPYHPPEHTISRKLIVAGVIVAMAGLIWLRWCNHGQPAATNSPPGSTVQAASTATVPSLPAAAAPAPVAATESPQPAPAADASPTAEPLPQSDAGAVEQPPVSTMPHRQPPARPAITRHVAVTHEASIAKDTTANGLATEPASPSSTGPPPASPKPALAPPPLTAGLPAGLHEQARVPPAPAAAAPSAQLAPPPFTLRPAPVAATKGGAPPQLSLSQGVVTAAPGTAGDDALSRDALRLLRDSAAAGDASAQLALALRYANGDGVRQSYPEALKWFSQAKAKGVVPTQPAAIAAWNRVQYWAQSHPRKP